mgnify:CR=1 FL=1
MSFLGAYVNMADYPEISSKDDSGKRVLYLFDPENPGNEDTEKGYIYYLREKELRIFKAGEFEFGTLLFACHTGCTADYL